MNTSAFSFSPFSIFWLSSTHSAVGKTLHPTLHLQHRRQISTHTITDMLSSNNWQWSTSFIRLSPVYSPKGYSSPLPVPAHSTEECRCSKDSLRAHTFSCMHIEFTHTWTHIVHVSLRHTHTHVSQLTHSLLFWVVLDRHCLENDRGNFPQWKNAMSSKCSSMPLQGRTPVFRFALLFPLLVFHSGSGFFILGQTCVYKKVSRGTYPWKAWVITLSAARPL